MGELKYYTWGKVFRFELSTYVLLYYGIGHGGAAANNKTLDDDGGELFI